jgi:hypothetical protein
MKAMPITSVIPSRPARRGGVRESICFIMDDSPSPEERRGTEREEVFCEVLVRRISYPVMSSLIFGPSYVRW